MGKRLGPGRSLDLDQRLQDLENHQCLKLTDLDHPGPGLGQDRGLGDLEENLTGLKRVEDPGPDHPGPGPHPAQAQVQPQDQEILGLDPEQREPLGLGPENLSPQYFEGTQSQVQLALSLRGEEESPGQGPDQGPGPDLHRVNLIEGSEILNRILQY